MCTDSKKNLKIYADKNKNKNYYTFQFTSQKIPSTLQSYQNR